MTTTDDSTLTLNLDVDVAGRIKAAASRRGIPVERYCVQAIEGELAKDESETFTAPSERRLTIPELIARRKQAFGDRVFPGDAVDIIREGREIRDAQMDEWS